MGLHFSKLKGFKKAVNKKQKYSQIPGTSTIIEEENPQRFSVNLPIRNMESILQASSSSDCSSITSTETTTNIPSQCERTAGSSSSRHRHHSHHRHHHRHRHSRKKESSEEDEQSEGVSTLCILSNTNPEDHCCRKKKSSAYPSRRCCKCAHRSSRSSVNLNTSISSSSTCSSAMSSPMVVAQARPESGEVILPVAAENGLLVIKYPEVDPLVPELQSALNISNDRQNKKLGRAQMTSLSSNQLIVHSQVNYYHCLVPDLEKITSSCYYWGKMDRYEAERLLEGKPEGTFLLRDSAQDEYLFSVTFRKYGRSLHARIEQCNHKFSFDCHDPGVFTTSTVTGLLEHYKDPSGVMFFEPMLTNPLNRNFTFSLQQLCRATIVSHTTYDGINELQLPATLKAYLKDYHYKQPVQVKHIDNAPIYSN